MQLSSGPRRRLYVELAAMALGGLVGAALATGLFSLVISPAFAVTIRHWIQVHQIVGWLTQPLVLPFWIAPLEGAGVYLGGRTALKLLAHWNLPAGGDGTE